MSEVVVKRRFIVVSIVLDAINWSGTIRTENVIIIVPIGSQVSQATDAEAVEINYSGC